VHHVDAPGDFRHSKFHFYSGHPTALHHHHRSVTLFMKDGIIRVLQRLFPADLPRDFLLVCGPQPASVREAS